MAFTTVQKVKDKYYLCEVTSEWDPVAKKNKQSRRYLGRCDKDGNLLESRTGWNTSLAFGQYYLMLAMAEECGAVEAAERVFGTSAGRAFVAAGIERALRSRRLTKVMDNVRDSFLPQMLGIVNLSEWFPFESFLNNLVTLHERRGELFGSMPHDPDCVIMETSSMRQPLAVRDLEALDRGATFRVYSLPLASLMVSVTTKGGVVEDYTDFRGKELDPASLAEIRESIEGSKPRNVEFFLDKKSWDSAKIASVMSSGQKISFELDKESKAAARILFDDESPDAVWDTIVYKGVVFRIRDAPAERFGKGVRTVTFINEKRRSDELLSLYSELETFEKQVSGIEWSAGVREYIDNYYGMSGMPDLFEFHEEGGKVKAVRLTDKIAEREIRCGRTLQVTNTDHDWKDLVRLYRKRRSVEYCVKVFRIDLEDCAALFPSLDSAYGALALEMFAIRIQSSLIRHIADSHMASRFDFMGLLDYVGELKATRHADSWRLNEMTLSQKSIFEDLKVQPPSDRIVRECVQAR